jgi:hypothetical protein
MLTGLGAGYQSAGKSKGKFRLAAWPGCLFLETNRVEREASRPNL